MPIMNPRQRWRRTTIANRTMVVLTAIIGFITLVNAILVGLQVWDNWKESTRLILATKDLKSALDNAVCQNKKNNERMLLQNKEILDATIAQSKATLDASIKTAQSDQRAWVGTTAISQPQCLDNGRRVFFASGCASIITIQVINSGKSIARNYKGMVEGRLVRAIDPFTFTFSARPLTSPLASVSVIQPATTVSMTIPPFTRLIDQSKLDALKNGTAMMYFFGKITYDDIFHNQHFTTFCFFLESSLTDMATCPTYNDAN